MSQEHSTTGNNEKIRDGLYLFYIKDEQIYPIILKENDWETLQTMGNSIAGNPIQIIDMPLGKVEYFTKRTVKP